MRDKDLNSRFAGVLFGGLPSRNLLIRLIFARRPCVQAGARP